VAERFLNRNDFKKKKTNAASWGKGNLSLSNREWRMDEGKTDVSISTFVKYKNTVKKDAEKKEKSPYFQSRIDYVKRQRWEPACYNEFLC
jgi:hypothetical protein